MASLYAHGCSFFYRLSWLSGFMGGAFHAAKFLIDGRGNPFFKGVASYHGIKFRFRNCDTTAMKEVLIDEEYDFLKEIVTNTQSIYVLDVGAHIGTFSMWVKNNNKQSKNFMVEANIDSYEIITSNFKSNFSNPSWKAINRAAWKNDDFIKFNNQGDTMGNRVSAQGNVQVQGISFHDVIEQALEFMPQINIMKIDIEGAEEAFFENSNHLLSKVERIVIELHPNSCDVEKVKTTLRNNYNNIREISGRLDAKPLLYCTNE